MCKKLHTVPVVSPPSPVVVMRRRSPGGPVPDVPNAASSITQHFNQLTKERR